MALTLSVMLLWPRLRTAVPAHLPAILIASIAALLLASSGHPVDTIGTRFSFTLPDGSSGAGIPPVLPLVQVGKLRAIAVTGNQRSAVLEKVPTVAESGFPGFDVTSWYGLFAPANTPPAVVPKVNKDLGDVLVSADIKEKFAAMGADPLVMRPDEFTNYVRNDIAKWEKVIKASGIK